MDEDFNPFEESDFEYHRDLRRRALAQIKEEETYQAWLADRRIVALAAAEEEEAAS